MDEGPVKRVRVHRGLTPLVRSTARRFAPSRYFPEYATYLARRANARYEPPSDPRYRLLVVNHYFDQDIAWLRRAADDVAIFEMPFLAFIEAAERELPPPAERFPGYYATELDLGRARYRRHVERMIDRLRADFRFDVVACTSDLFWWNRVFPEVLGPREIPFVVIEKEGLMTPLFFKLYSREFREHAPPTADRHMVWSKRQAEFYELCGQRPNRIVVTGQPRSDFWSHPDEWATKEDLGLPLRREAPLVVAFDYESWFYLPWEWYERGEFDWEPLRRATAEAMIELAAARPEVDFVIKLHPMQDEWLLESRSVPPNLHVIGGATLGNALLLNGDVLILFQSTAMVEAMTRDCPIVYPFFGDAKRHESLLLPFHKHEIVNIARSKHDIVAAIEAGLLEPVVTPKVGARRRAFLNDYLYRPDGNASRRVLDAVAELLTPTKIATLIPAGSLGR